MDKKCHPIYKTNIKTKKRKKRRDGPSKGYSQVPWEINNGHSLLVCSIATSRFICLTFDGLTDPNLQPGSLAGRLLVRNAPDGIANVWSTDACERTHFLAPRCHQLINSINTVCFQRLQTNWDDNLKIEMSQKAPYAEYWFPENVNHRAPGQASRPPRHRGGGLLFLNVETGPGTSPHATMHTCIYTAVQNLLKS